MSSGIDDRDKTDSGEFVTAAGTTNKKLYEFVGSKCRRWGDFNSYHNDLWGALRIADPDVYRLLSAEYTRFQDTIQLVAAENFCSRAALAALGSIAQNKTAEGFAGARFHGGCEVVDQIEKLAVSRAMEAFGAKYANVQPHSGSQANQIILTALLDKGDGVLSLAQDHGGHASHGAQASFARKFFAVEHYYLDKNSLRLDYQEIARLAKEFAPKLIVCGASAYPRVIDFARFREVADSVGAFLLADISHISGLVIAGAHPSPINHAHFTATSTYKAGGPRGGLILMGKDAELHVNINGGLKLRELIDRATFPGVQGTPFFSNIAAKAVFLRETIGHEYKTRQFKVIENAKRLAANLVELGYNVLTRGTDNHMVLVDVDSLRAGLTGFVAQKCLECCGIVVDMYRLPYDGRSAAVGGGMRLGTPIVTKRGMSLAEIDLVSELADRVLRSVTILGETAYSLDETVASQIRRKVKNLCSKFPIV